MQSRSLELCVEERDGQTHTNKKLIIFAPPDGMQTPSPVKLGVMIKDLEHVRAPVPGTPQLSTPMTLEPLNISPQVLLYEPP